MPAVEPTSTSPTAVLQRLLLVAVLLVVAVLVDATVPAGEPQAEGFTAPLPTGSATPAPQSVAAVDQLVFSNQYEKADRAYMAVLTTAPEDPTAHTAYALFLNYDGDLARALSEARRGVALAPDVGRSHAVLCRVLDWNGVIAEAVSEGRRAVQLAPADPLAHLYLSEALADSGSSAAAQSEIDAATRLITPASPPYVRAETHREVANLAHDRGDHLAQIDALILAEKEQPDWVERVVELAGALFDDNDVARAHTEFARALALRGGDVGMLVRLGGAAIVSGDYDDAATAFHRAAQVAPDDVAVLHGLAQVAMAHDGDPDAAAADLAAALRADPTDTQAAAYLLYIARDVWEDEARGRAMIAEAIAGASDVRPSPRRAALPDVDTLIAAHARRALAQVNKVRVAAGLAPVKLDDRLDAAAVAHSFYWLFNQARPSQQGLGIHGETPGTPGFSGATVIDRANQFGWHDGPVGEDITHRGSPEAAVADWVNSVYHRFPIMRPDLRVIGYADAGFLSLPIEDMEFGFAYPGASHAPVVYPAAGQTNVPATFDDNELPDPVPAGGPRVTGYPVTVTFDRYSSVRVSSFTLSGPTGMVGFVFTLAPSDETENSASLLPGAPLVAGATYTAHIVGTVDGAAYQRTWSFTVQNSG
jgi:tetratricopeptide (TPR) repeat protein